IARFGSFNRQLGILTVEITHVGGDPGLHEDVEIVATGGASIAEIMTLEQAMAALEQAEGAGAARDVAVEAAGTAISAADAAIAAAEAAAQFDPSSYYDKEEVDSALAEKANAASLAAVAVSGSYNDLGDRPPPPGWDVVDT